MTFFNDDSRGSGPAITDAVVARAEARLGLRLPKALVAVLRERNGGVPARRCFRTSVPTSWADDHIEMSVLLGVGFERGIDGGLGSAYLVEEWQYPDVGIVIGLTPSGGHDAIMLDYRDADPTREPRVVYVADDGQILPLADDFATFARGLVDCSALAKK